MNARMQWIAGLVMVLAAGWALALAADDESAPAAPAAPSAGAETPTLTAEQLDKFLKEAREKRMALERDQVVAEIRGGIVFNPAKIEEAVKGLGDNPKNTWADNSERICNAFALVDNRFANAWKLFTQGDFEAAAGAFKPLISERDSTYLSAAKHFCYAEALTGMGKDEDAIDAYLDLVKTMPDRFSFTAQSMLKIGKTYEKIHRLYNAMSFYYGWVECFGMLDPDLARELTERADKIAADYKDPLGTLANKMNEVQKRLAQIDSGRNTQEKQREIVSMLDDLIASAQQQQQQSSSSSSQQHDKKKQEEQQQSSGRGSQGQGKSNGPPQGTGIPSSPARVSALVGGEVARPAGLSEVRPSDGTDDWGKLPPTERQKLLEAFKESLPERYREQISDYYTRISSGGR